MTAVVGAMFILTFPRSELAEISSFSPFSTHHANHAETRTDRMPLIVDLGLGNVLRC